MPLIGCDSNCIVKLISRPRDDLPLYNFGVMRLFLHHQLQMLTWLGPETNTRGPCVLSPRACKRLVCWIFIISAHVKLSSALRCRKIIYLMLFFYKSFYLKSIKQDLLIGQIVGSYAFFSMVDHRFRPLSNGTETWLHNNRILLLLSFLINRSYFFRKAL